METKRIMTLISFVLLLGFVCGCSNRLNQSSDIASLIEINYQNGSKISPGGEIEAWIKNLTNVCISFPIDFNIRVFVEQDGGWVEVQNLVNYVSDRPEVLKPKGDIFSETLVIIRPDVSRIVIAEPVDAYALITGHLCDDKSYKIEKTIPFVIIP